MHKTLRRFTVMAAIAVSTLLLSPLQSTGFAQEEDTEAQLVQPDNRRSQPGVVTRTAPAGEGDIGEDDGSGASDGKTPGVGVEGGVIFGESLDFEQNFGADFGVKTSPKNLKITLDFRDAELSDVVKLMSAQTGRNFIVADSLRAGKKITIISPNPVSQAEAYQAFLSALHMNGLTVVQNGKFYKIIELNNGVKEPITATYGSVTIPQNDALVTHIASVKYVDVSQIKAVLDQLKTPNGQIIEYTAANSLIITDTGNSVNRMLKFIEKMDTDSSDSEKVWVYPVQYASVTDLEKLLGQVFQTSGNVRNRNVNNRNNANNDANNELRISQIVGDERTNKLIIVADERSYEKMKRLILKLDVEIPDSGKINVVHLQNSEANEIYTALNQIISDLTSKNGSNRNNVNANNSQRTLQGEDISVVASESTNDLIVVASPRDFLAIKNVIKELDRPRRQVFIEAAIMEVSLERSRSLGIAMHGGNVFETGAGDGYYAGRTELNSLQSLSPAAMFLGSGSTPGFLMALAGPSLEIAGLSIPGIGAVVNALQTNTDVNVLSTPTVLALDNEEAEISVGERIPYVTSSTSNYSSLLNGLAGGNASADALGSLLSGYGTTIERVDVALTLKIKPQINEGGTVRLNIEEEIEEVKPGGSDIGGPSTRMRNLKTVVVVPDQQTVVLGGLVRDSESQSVSKVPLLGDIPVLGYLFRSTERTIQKQNLLLMLTPYIIESSADLNKISKRKQEERDEFVSFFGRKDINYVRSVDYDKKHGLLEDIRQSIDNREDELNAIREAQNIVEFGGDDEGIELPDGFSDGYSSVTGGTVSSSTRANAAARGISPRPSGKRGGSRVQQGGGERR